MCLILFAYDQHPNYKLVLAANRDEFYNRATEKAGFWEDNPSILAGRDLEKMGTWMGINKENGRFAAITNYRDLSSINENAISRGELVSNYLDNNEASIEYLQKVNDNGHLYNGFNLLTGDSTTMHYYSNYGNRFAKITTGIHGLSNRHLNTPWPKVELGKKKLDNCLSKDQIDPDCLFEILTNTDQPKNEDLPDTGVGIKLERLLAPIFIKSKDYGTRASTVLLIDRNENVTFIERSYQGNEKEWKETSFEFKISEKSRIL